MFQPPLVIDIPTGAPRYWFIDMLGLLQLQDTRLIVNWRKSQESDAYPRYPSCLDLDAGTATALHRPWDDGLGHQARRA